MRKTKKYQRSFFVLILLASSLPLINLLTPGLPVTHDGLDHVARIANFYKNLEEGVLIPRWAGNLNWGFGHPILMFLYPLPSYMTSFFHFLGLSLVDSLKLFFAVSYVLSGFFMYLWLKEFLGRIPASLGAILYLYAPYRFVDLYVRGAIGEHAAFTFMPLVLLGIYKLFKTSGDKKPTIYYVSIAITSISFAGLILSHNAISLIFIPFIVFYIFYLFLQKKSKTNVIFSFFSLFLGFLFSFFFWFPAFMEGKYTLRDIVTTGEYSSRFVDPLSLIFGSWNFGISGQFSVQIGIPHIALTLLASMFLIRQVLKKDKYDFLMLGCLVILAASIFLMMHQSNFIWEKITTLQKLQFPWRFLSIVVFLTSLIGALIISKLKISKKNLIASILIILSIFLTKDYWQAKEYKTIPDSFFKTVYGGTTDTGESAPIWSVRFMERAPSTEAGIIEGKGEIKKISRKTTEHEYEINVTERSRIRENTLYFPGWKVYDNGREIKDIEFQDPKNRGLITFYLDRGEHNVLLKFEETKLRRFSNFVSFFSISLAAVLFFVLRKNEKNV